MSDSILLPKIIGHLEWKEAKEFLEKNYELSIDESEELFCAKYNHGSRLWRYGTEEQKLMLTQNRGTIYEKCQPYRLICLPFYKFWNYNEPQSKRKPVNWNSFSEKVDGYFFKLYYYQDQWHVSSNSKINIKKLREKYLRSGKTNEQLWNEAANQVQLDYSKLNQNYSYFFERVHPDYKIVIQYHQPMLFHLGTRDMITLEELEIDIGIPKPKTYQFENLNQCISYVNEMNLNEGEGIVACDLNTYQRIKIKSHAYLITHYRSIGIENSFKQIRFSLSIWLEGEEEEYFNYFPQYLEDYQQTEYEIEQRIIPHLVNQFNKFYSNEKKRFFHNLNNEYPSKGKSDQDRERLIFTKLYQYDNNWNDFNDEQKRSSIRKILRQRNTDNQRKFIFQKYLHSFFNNSF